MPEKLQPTMEPLEDEVDHVRGPSAARVSSSTATTNAPTRGRRSARSNRSSANSTVAFASPGTSADRHPPARAAASAAEAAALQDRFWAMHGLLFHRQKALEDDDLRRYAAELELDVARFDQDRPERRPGRIRRDVESALASGDVRGTPTVHRRRRAPRRLRRSDLAGSIGPMSAICSHTDSITLTEVAGPDRRLHGLPRDRRNVAAPAHVPVLRPHRLLRQLTEPSRLRPRPRLRTPDHSLRRTGEDWSWCYLDNVAFVVTDDDAPRAAPRRLAPDEGHLHLYAQIVGKIRLATTAPRNHWWNVPSTSTSAGSQRRLHHRGTTFEIRLDFLDHALLVQTADAQPGVPARRRDTRRGLRPASTPCSPSSASTSRSRSSRSASMTTPFPEDVEHASWDREAIERFGRILDWTDSVFEEFSGWFNGKTARCTSSGTASTSPSRLLGPTWRRARRRSRHQEAYSHEVISFGFWAGDDTVDATYYSTPRPSPRGSASNRFRGQLDRVRLRLVGGASLRDRAQRARSTNDAACVLPERLRGGRSPCRLGHQQLRIEMVSDPRAAEPAPRQRCRRVRPSQRGHLACRAERAASLQKMQRGTHTE